MKLESLSDDIILKLITTLDIREIIKFELLNKDLNKFIKKNDNFISFKIIKKKFKLIENSKSYNLKTNHIVYL